MTELEIVDRLVELADANATISFDALAEYGISVVMNFRLPGDAKQNGSAWLKKLPAPIAGTLEFSFSSSEPDAMSDLQQQILEKQEQLVDAQTNLARTQTELARLESGEVNLSPDQENALGAYLVDLQAVIDGTAQVLEGATDFVRDVLNRPG